MDVKSAPRDLSKRDNLEQPVDVKSDPRVLSMRDNLEQSVDVKSALRGTSLIAEIFFSLAVVS